MRRIHPPLHWILLSLLALSLLAGCGGITRPEQARQASWLPLTPAAPVGQTFSAAYRGLQGVRLPLRTTDGQPQAVHLRLYAGVGENEPLRVASATVPAGTETVNLDFRFDPLTDSSQRAYYLELELVGEGQMQVAAAPAEVYLDGAAYVDRQAQETQLAFFLDYQTTGLLAGLGLEALRWLGLLALGLWLLALPGWALLSAVWYGWERLDPLARLALAAPLGLAIYPPLLLAGEVLALPPGALLAWAPPLLALLYLGARALQRRGRPRPRPKPEQQPAARWTTQLFWLAALAVLGALALSRWWVVRGLAAPMWGDSVQHTTITRLLLDQGGLFSSWLPYAPYQTFSVHYGFSAAAALLSWSVNLSVTQAVLVAGQGLNLLAVLALYPLGLLLSGGNRWAGLGAVLTAGLLLPIPAVYTNWGRYAQLAGQVLLPLLIWLTLDLNQPRALPPRRWLPMALLGGLALAGMALCYYRMPIYYALFVAAWLPVWALQRQHWRRENWLRLAGSLAVIALTGVLLLLPWLAQLAGGTLAEAVVSGVSRATALAQRLADFQTWRLLPEYIPVGVLVLAGGGLVMTIWRRRWLALTLPLWVLLLVAYFFGGLLQLPAANMLDNFSILILMYLPAGLLAGLLLGEAAVLVRQPAWAGSALAALLLAGLALWGLPGQVRLGDPVNHALVTQPDLRAADWMARELPPEAIVLVQGYTISGGRSAVGSDAGWWLPLLAGRANSMPPQYALLAEQPIEPGYSQRVVELVAALEKQPVDSPLVLAELCERGIGYVFVGQRQGQVGAGARQLYAPADLLASPAFDLLYHQDRVYVFGLDPSACPVQP